MFQGLKFQLEHEKGEPRLGQCLAIRPNLTAWRCRRQAGNRWFCSQHKRWPLLCLGGLIVTVLIPVGILYLWGKFAPPTGVEGEQLKIAQNTQSDVRDIKKLLENPSKNIPELTKFIDSQGLEAKYPLGYALFYTDGRKTLYYGSPKSSFDPASVQVISLTQNQIRFNADLKDSGTKSEIQMNDAYIDMDVPGLHSLMVVGSLHFYVELIAHSVGEAAWIIGVKKNT